LVAETSGKSAFDVKKAAEISACRNFESAGRVLKLVFLVLVADKKLVFVVIFGRWRLRETDRNEKRKN
jgi:hypothetical protein